MHIIHIQKIAYIKYVASHRCVCDSVVLVRVQVIDNCARDLRLAYHSLIASAAYDLYLIANKLMHHKFTVDLIQQDIHLVWAPMWAPGL